jgi:hypothetical protein
MSTVGAFVPFVLAGGTRTGTRTPSNIFSYVERHTVCTVLPVLYVANTRRTCKKHKKCCADNTTVLVESLEHEDHKVHLSIVIHSEL